ncbi:hypothetical protein FACS189437_01460 [Bacteroidia bacterium]|nr:hypothetical protein FACS189437_01460 [Bacteroidia bacterium]
MKKMMFLMLTLFLWGAANVNAQVTIGSNTEPHSGAILDLQSDNLGLKLPNVELDDDLTQFVLPEEGDFTKDNAIGMIVYNTNTNVSEGIYAWNGKRWVKPEADKSIMGRSADNPGRMWASGVDPVSLSCFTIPCK